MFYRHYYPMGDKEGPFKQALWDEFNYSRGMKRDKPSDDERFQRFSGVYEREMRDLFNIVMAASRGRRRGVVVIPSSTKGEVNRITKLTRDVLASNPGVFADLTYHVTRVRSKAKAHAGGSRSYSEAYDTIGIDRRADISQYEVLLVIDDILTSGTSFRVMDDRLRASGFSGTIVNFAFSRTFPSEGAVCCWERERSGFQTARRLKQQNSGKPIEGLVFDLDQTLLDDSLRDVEFEEWLTSHNSFHCKSPYAPYEGIEGMARLGIPFAIVSNRPPSQVMQLLGDSSVFDVLYPGYGGKPLDLPLQMALSIVPTYFESDDEEMIDSGVIRAGHELMPHNAFSFPKETSGGYTVSYYKPSPRGVRNALRYLREEFLERREDARIVGIGNTYEDVVAYGAAGIESALVLWGVPDEIKEYARCEWGADFTFNTVEELVEWMASNTRYYEMALEAEHTDPERACKLFALAIECNDNIRDAAFSLARMLHKKDPESAALFYEMAIEAGEECASTNNLAMLVQGDDPKLAESLFERAIAAGSVKAASNNLANLIRGRDPERAIELYRQAIDAGDERYATRNLARLIEDREPVEAAQLYRRAIDAGDEYHATRELALLLRDSDPVTSARMLERAADAGNVENLSSDLEPLVRSACGEAVAVFERLIVSKHPSKAFDLALMVSGSDPEKAKSLYEMAISAGDEYASTNNLGLLVQRAEPKRAKALFERAIAAGDEWYATVNLARLIRDENPERAFELLRRAASEGRRDLAEDLEPFIIMRMPEAIGLYKEVVVTENGQMANNLAELIKGFSPIEAMRLYQIAIDAGDERYATCNLGTMLMGEHPERAKSLFERAIAAGDELVATNNLGVLLFDEDPLRARGLFERAVAAGDECYATNSLGVLIMREHPERAKSLFERAIAAGDARCAPCNLAHAIISTNPGKAISLYEQSVAYGETEALIGLAYLLQDVDRSRSDACLSRARLADDRGKSVRASLKLMGDADMAAAMEVARYLSSNGFDEATDTLVTMALGEKRHPSKRTVFFGVFPDNQTPVGWTIIQQDADSILLLSQESLTSMQFCNDSPTAIWDDSEVRKWLNTVFADNWLDEEDVAKLIPIEKTGDLVFCLTVEDIESLSLCDRGVLECRDHNTSLYADWWLRPNSGTTASAPYVSKEGKVKWKLALLSLGVRPAVRISLHPLSQVDMECEASIQRVKNGAVGSTAKCDNDGKHDQRNPVTSSLAKVLHSLKKAFRASE